jgi:16S rRNA (guanine1207-N2)-methyltransferase
MTLRDNLATVTHYFDEHPNVDSNLKVVDVTLSDITFTMRTDRGVFSHGHLDTGTAFLLQDTPAPAPSGVLLDLGCGSGAMALALALRAPEATVWAVDVNERARQLTETNARLNGLTNVHVASPDDVPATLRFDVIWSNPPIRVGKQALHELLTSWLSRLNDAGEAILVVQKHLGSDSLQRWLNDQGYPASRLSSRSGFRLLRVTHGR